MGFRVLRVFNQDRVAPGRAFGMHPHDNTEFISYVLKGAVEHRDTMGAATAQRPSEVQVLSAGSGVAHGEYNASPTGPQPFLRIWIESDEMSLDFPLCHEQKALPPSPRSTPADAPVRRRGERGLEHGRAGTL
jgi:redox-sensitive bicupin YhaK (pirin superfamily)